MPTTIDLTPDTLDLVLYAGDGCDFQINFVDDTNTPINVSAWNWRAQIRKTRNSNNFIPLTINTANSANGNIVVSISETITRELVSQENNTVNQWDLESISVGSTAPVTVLQGTVYCNMDVTR